MNLDQSQKTYIAKLEQVMKAQFEKLLSPESQKSPSRPKMISDLQTFEDQIFGLMKERVSFARMKPESIKVYDETFTLEEVAGMIAFYKSPAGQAYVQKAPILTSKIAELSGKLMGDSMQEIQEMSAKWAVEMREKYGDAGAH